MKMMFNSESILLSTTTPTRAHAPTNFGEGIGGGDGMIDHAPCWSSNRTFGGYFTPFFSASSAVSTISVTTPVCLPPRLLEETVSPTSICSPFLSATGIFRIFIFMRYECKMVEGKAKMTEIKLSPHKALKLRPQLMMS